MKKNGKKILLLCLSAAILLPLLFVHIAPVSADQVNDEDFRLIGRTHIRSDILSEVFYLGWTGSGFSFRFTGSGVMALINSTTIAASNMGYLNVYVDGAILPSNTIAIDRTASTYYTLVEDLDYGEHTVTVKKRNEAGNSNAVIGILDVIVYDGPFLPPPPPPARVIEFVGDSITSGLGNMIYEPGNEDYSSAITEGTKTYAMLTADAFGASASVLSRRGIRFCREPGKAADTESMISHYTKTASLSGGSAEWGFARPADVVVINLGTNDNGIVDNPDTEFVADAAYFKGEATALLELIRAKNPGALIVWAYGMMGEAAKIADPVKAAIADLTAAGDKKMFYFSLSGIRSSLEGSGVFGHPTIFGNINNSFALTAFIAGKTGWAYSFKPQLAVQMDEIARLELAGEEELAAYTDKTAALMKDTLAGAAAALESGTPEEMKNYCARLQLARTQMRLKDHNYNYAKIDVSSGELECLNAAVGGRGDSVRVVENEDGKFSYRLPVQNQGFGLRVDPSILNESNRNITILVDFFFPTIPDMELPNTRLNLRYTDTTGAIAGSQLLRTETFADEWATWAITLEDARLNRQVDGSTDFNIIKYGSDNEESDGIDYVYIRSVKVYVTPDFTALDQAL
ncbi:MAG: GDSL-type esterase/lipase family protein, partial [Oscillospiraceae bacterium]|nr:GDSL-type esterase/lipase family protein [Oscillospiraceae bacterium]